MTNKHTISALLWAANAVVWGMAYVIDKNRRSEIKEREKLPPGCVRVDFSSQELLQVVYQKKLIPEFSIYQV